VARAGADTVSLMRTLVSALVVAGVLVAASSHAQDYPSKPVRAITALSAGGTSDVFMRVAGDQFQKKTGQPIIVENRPGGAFNIAGQACADAAPDGYTICLLPVETLSYNQFMFKKISYDPRKFEPISNLFFVTAVLVVNSSLGARSLPDLAAHSKSKPGTLSYMSPAVPLALFMENWRKDNGADIVKVPYRGGADAANAILQGSTPVAFSGLANFIPHIRSGAMTALAVDTDQRSPLLPDVPTLRELKYTGPLTPAYFGLVAPAGTPKTIIAKLHDVFVEIAGHKAFAERNMISLGLIPVLDTPEQFAGYLKENWGLAERIVKEAGVEPQ
jgi:tripartite-type tricarboxylate transporter receptor subunit TctC